MKHKLNIQSQGEIPKESEIEHFEKEIGIRIPNSYREFLLSTNAKYVGECNYEISDKIYEIHGFTTFGSGDWTLEQNYRNLKEHFENRYLAFAFDSGGWQYIISIEQNENYGKIYFCRMDEEIDNATTFLANTFQEFIKGFHVNLNA